MRPTHIDAIVDLAYGALIILSVVLIATLDTYIGVAFGVGVFASYVVHVVWKMARFDPEWMTRVVEETVGETVEKEVGPRVEQTVSETVEKEVSPQVEQTVSETVEESVTKQVQEVQEQVESVEERVDRRPREDQVEALIEESVETNQENEDRGNDETDDDR